MKWMTAIYRLLFRLYPVAFRHEFEDEMQVIFAQALADADAPQQLYLLLIELRDFPINIIRQHLAELKRKEAIMLNLAQPISQNGQVYRICCGLISAVLVVTVLCSILPFYVFGLHQQPANEIVGGLFDPKGMAFYQTLPGSIIRFTGIIMFFAVPIVLVGFMPLLLRSFARDRRSLPVKWQAYGFSLAIFSTALVGFMYLGMGRLILTWLLD